jgi:serine/threonine protein kinase
LRTVGPVRDSLPHRDVKPANVLVDTRTGACKLND